MTTSDRPATFGRKYGLGRSLPTPREHCKRCKEITARADQMAMNYVMANGRQVEIINRLLEDDHDGAKEIVVLGQLLAEKDGLITALYGLFAEGSPQGQQVREFIDEFYKEVNGDGDERRGAQGTA